MDPHSFFADPDPAGFFQCGSGSRFFLNANPDLVPALKTVKKLSYQEIAVVEINKRDCSKLKKQEAG